MGNGLRFSHWLLHPFLKVCHLDRLGFLFLLRLSLNIQHILFSNCTFSASSNYILNVNIVLWCQISGCWRQSLQLWFFCLLWLLILLYHLLWLLLRNFLRSLLLFLWLLSCTRLLICLNFEEKFTHLADILFIVESFMDFTIKCAWNLSEHLICGDIGNWVKLEYY